MAHNRSERRRKTALIKRKLEREVKRELAKYVKWDTEGRTTYRSSRACYGHSEHAIRRRWFKNEGRNGRSCWECGSHACDWCLDGFYRKHYQRAQSLENDLQEYLNGGYDALREEGVDIPVALLVHLPRPMGICRPK
jgi:hypothetical protein